MSPFLFPFRISDFGFRISDFKPKSEIRNCLAALVLFLAVACPALAQQAQPGLPLGRLDSLTPCGAKAIP